METFYFTPGQTATLFLETIDSDGYRFDGYLSPSAYRVFQPDSTWLELNDPLTQISTGLYKYSYVLPRTASAIGSYLFEFYYYDVLHRPFTKLYQVIVTAPYGNYGTSI